MKGLACIGSEPASAATRRGAPRQRSRQLAIDIAPAASRAQSPATPCAGDADSRRAVARRPGIGDPYFPLLGNGGYDAIHYTIDLDLDVEAGSILEATTTIDAVATQDLSAFNLDFRGPQIDAVTVDGAPPTGRGTAAN